MGGGRLGGEIAASRLTDDHNKKHRARRPDGLPPNVSFLPCQGSDPDIKQNLRGMKAVRWCRWFGSDWGGEGGNGIQTIVSGLVCRAEPDGKLISVAKRISLMFCCEGSSEIPASLFALSRGGAADGGGGV